MICKLITIVKTHLVLTSINLESLKCDDNWVTISVISS